MTHGDQSVQALSEPFPRWLLVLLGTATAATTIAGLRGISDLVGPVFLALVLTIAAHPLRGWLQARHLPGWLAVLLTVYVFILAFGLASRGHRRVCFPAADVQRPRWSPRSRTSRPRSRTWASTSPSSRQSQDP